MHRKKSLCISLTKIPINIAQIHVFIFEWDICRYVDFYTSAQPPQITFIFMYELFLQYCHGGLTINVVAVEEDVRCEDICAYNYLVFLSELTQGKEGYLNTEAQLIKE